VDRLRRGRRVERLEALAHETGTIAAPCDITSEAEVAALRDRVLGEQGRVDALLNISGGARGTDWVAEAKDEDWEWRVGSWRGGVAWQ
jgi:NADP-dependent 3-hydroxy acid dehydrogenase YdfG